VAQRRAVAGRARGGEDIQAPRPVYARLATGAGALLVAAALAAATLLRGEGHQPLLVAVGLLALALLLGGLALRWSAALAVGVALLGAQQAVRLALGPDSLDSWTPLFAGGLLLVAELAWWSLEPRVPAWSQPGLAARRVGTVLLACAGACVVSAVVLVAAGVPLSGGFGLELAGVVAATGALAVVAWLARSRVG
jgi:hypothetical protein